MSVPTSYKLASGRSIPSMGLGTYLISPPDKVTYEALKAGFRLIDSAVMYHNEKGVGDGIAKWLQEDPENNRREDVVYATKLLDSQQGYETAKRSIDESLQKVKAIGHIDLFLIHSPQTNRKLRLGTWQALQEAVDEGKVKEIGVSNYGIHHLKELLEWEGLKYRPVVNQCELSPWLQRNDIAEFCRKEGILMEGYSPLTQGHKLNDRTLKALAKKYNRDVGQILIRWSLQKGYIPIPKTKTVSRLKSNLEVYDFELEKEDFESLGDPNAYEVFDWDPTTYRG
ncbi:hypothetical protein TRICI_001571 [Trichomonascus ciferrii]|uniref:NADP-dependent oxidoreductase domain-containing protein n=1 Tax=Trichomonascus ciferrii TaxID=44093 RepID=A0A642V9C4_9ASCO|nr:hypothetical protein TRICI_001571 [Trichomonascus ciferrii]